MEEYTKFKTAINCYYHKNENLNKAYKGDTLCFRRIVGEKEFFKYTGDVGDFYYGNGKFSTDVDLSKGTPIGMVVIPRNFIPSSPNGRVMSLVNMSVHGFTGTTEDETMYWGLYNVNLSSTSSLRIKTYGTGATVDTSVSSRQYANIFYPSDRLNDGKPQRVQSPEYKDGYYSGSGSTDYHGVCPYIMDESGNITFNENYFKDSKNESLWWDGSYITSALCTWATGQTDWQTAESIENKSTSGYAPCFCACKRFNVGGLDWYLPACAELGFLIPKKQVLRNQLQKLIDNGGTAAQFNDNNYSVMSSSTPRTATTKFGYWLSYESINYYPELTAARNANNNIQRAFALI